MFHHCSVCVLFPRKIHPQNKRKEFVTNSQLVSVCLSLCSGRRLTVQMSFSDIGESGEERISVRHTADEPFLNTGRHRFLNEDLVDLSQVGWTADGRFPWRRNLSSFELLPIDLIEERLTFDIGHIFSSTAETFTGNLSQ